MSFSPPFKQFAYTGMTADMCEQLTEDYAIILTADGRMSVAGLNDFKIDYVAEAIHAVSDNKSITD
jgi:aspartate/tyrosine/aromatic aminotransferase